MVNKKKKTVNKKKVIMTDKEAMYELTRTIKRYMYMWDYDLTVQYVDILEEDEDIWGRVEVDYRYRRIDIEFTNDVVAWIFDKKKFDDIASLALHEILHAYTNIWHRVYNDSAQSLKLDLWHNKFVLVANQMMFLEENMLTQLEEAVLQMMKTQPWYKEIKKKILKSNK